MPTRGMPRQGPTNDRRPICPSQHRGVLSRLHSYCGSVESGRRGVVHDLAGLVGGEASVSTGDRNAGGQSS